MRSDTPDVVTGDLVRLKYPRTVDDFWHVRSMTRIDSVFDRVLIPWGRVLLYVGRLSSDDEIDASYFQSAPGDEAGYTPIMPWGWCIVSERDINTIVAVNLSFVERV